MGMIPRSGEPGQAESRDPSKRSVRQDVVAVTVALAGLASELIRVLFS